MEDDEDWFFDLDSEEAVCFECGEHLYDCICDLRDLDEEIPF